jgi:integrase
MAAKPKRDFTDRFLKSIKPAAAGDRDLYRDAQVPGFGLRVTDKSSAENVGSFVLVARFPGSANPTARRIGDYPALTLGAAREIARGWREDLRQGIDPKEKAARQRREEARRKVETFAAAFDAYAEDRLSQLRSGKVVKSVVERLVYPDWGARPMREIKRSDGVDLLRRVKKQAPVGVNRLLAYLKTFGVWAIDEGLVDDSPFATLKRPTSEKERSRDRVLTDLEIRAIWQASSAIGVFGAAFKMMLLTGQRRTEVGAMRWSELNLREKTWTLPKARTKAKRGHQVPLTDLAISIIEGVPKLSEFVFSGRRRPDRATAAELVTGPIGGWGKAKERLDRLAIEDLKRIAAETGDDPPDTFDEWHLHDLRRTCATRLAKLGASRIVVAKVLNHAIPGVTSTYDHHDYEPEKREALDRWALWIESTVGGTGDNVVVFPKARA